MAASKLKNVVFLIASGSKNLGGTCARNVVERGGKVVLCDSESMKDAGEELQQSLGQRDFMFVPTDLSKEDDVRNALKLTKEKYGRLDVTINCPYFAKSSRMMIMKDVPEENPNLSGEIMELLFKTNVTSVFNVCRLSAELMAENSPDSNGQRGVIINKSHRLAFNSSLAPYSMSQAAIIGMTLPMARDFKDLGVRVNSIATGFYRYQIPHMKELTFQKFLSMMPFPYSLGSEDTFYHLCEKIVTNPYINGEVVKLDGAINTSFF